MSVPDRQLVEIARIGKPQGLEGVVRIHLSVDAGEAGTLFEEGDLLYVKTRRGDLMPIRVDDLRVEDKRNQRSFFVKFDRIADRSQAEEFQGASLLSDQLSEIDEENPEDSVIGYRVFMDQQPVGTVQDVMENPAHPILIIQPNDPSPEFLVPWVDEYVLHVRPTERIIECRNLDLLKNI